MFGSVDDPFFGQPAQLMELWEDMVPTARQAGDPTTLITLLTAGEDPLGVLTDEECAIRSSLLADTNADGQDSANIPLVDAACRENLRISPPATLAGKRVLTAVTEMYGRQLSAGSRLTPCIYVTHHRADLYPDPFRFDPDRFYRKSRSAQEYLPFGGGTRRCLGADLATLELRMITAAVLCHLDLRPAVPRVVVRVVHPQISTSARSSHSTGFVIAAAVTALPAGIAGFVPVACAAPVTARELAATRPAARAQAHRGIRLRIGSPQQGELVWVSRPMRHGRRM